MELDGLKRMTKRVPRLAVALVVGGGAIWVVAAALYSAEVVSCFTCASAVVAPGMDTTGYPLSAIRTLAWDDLYANLYVATAGFLAIAIGAGPFRRGERWAWYAIAIFVLAGAATGLLDYLSWGGWFTFLFLGLPQLLGLALATGSYFPREGHGR
jgi:hypothetical protein